MNEKRECRMFQPEGIAWGKAQMEEQTWQTGEKKVQRPGAVLGAGWVDGRWWEP